MNWMKDYKKYKDENLISKIAKNQKDANMAFDAIYERYACKLNAFCSFKNNSSADAEEVFEDTWLKFIDYVRNGNQVSNVLSFLYSTAKNISIDNFRKKNAKKAIKIDYHEDIELLNAVIDDCFIKEMETKELISLVKTLIENLKDTLKTPFLMQWFGEMSYKEIADELGITPENAKMRCHRAMKELMKILKPYYSELIN